VNAIDNTVAITNTCVGENLGKMLGNLNVQKRMCTPPLVRLGITTRSILNGPIVINIKKKGQSLSQLRGSPIHLFKGHELVYITPKI